MAGGRIHMTVKGTEDFKRERSTVLYEMQEEARQKAIAEHHAAQRKVRSSTTIHRVKSWTHLFEQIITGSKKHDIRDMRERAYKVGDILHLQEFDMAKGVYTGRSAETRITYITDRLTPCAFSSAVLDQHFGILSLELVDWDDGI